MARDYAIQHLGLSYELAADKAQIQRALWEAVEETDKTVAGTALLALHRLSGQFAGFDPARVDQSALNLASDQRVGEPARITALQVCAERGLLDVIPTALTLARSATSIPLKISAISALGALGGTELVPWLEQLVTGVTSLDSGFHFCYRRPRVRMTKGNYRMQRCDPNYSANPVCVGQVVTGTATAPSPCNPTITVTGPHGTSWTGAGSVSISYSVTDSDYWPPYGTVGFVASAYGSVVAATTLEVGPRLPDPCTITEIREFYSVVSRLL